MKSNRLSFVLKQMNVQFRMRALSVFSFGLLVVQPAVFSGIGYLLARMAGRAMPDLFHVIIGGGIMGLWSSLVFTSFFDISNDRREGTLELIVGSPTSLGSILAIRTLTNIITGTISLALSFLVVMLVFHYSPPINNLLPIVLSLGIMLFAFWCIGFFLAHFQVWSRLSGTFINYLELPVAILAAFMFPFEYLPHWIRWLSNMLPIRWAVTALGTSFQPVIEIQNLWPDWLFALGISCVYLIVTFYLSRRVHDMIRVSGELHSV